MASQLTLAESARLVAVGALAAVAVVAAVANAGGCAATGVQAIDSGKRFTVEKGVVSGVGAVVVTDTETGVEYFVSGNAVTPLYNSDGSLRTVDEPSSE